jgi:hypothetical protein
LKNRFKNLRKSKPQSGVKRPGARQVVETIKHKKIQKFFVLARLPAKPEGETMDTCSEHVTVMKKDMLKSTNKNVVMIKKLMVLTYPFRRENILVELTVVENITKEYSALNLISEVSYSSVDSDFIRH